MGIKVNEGPIERAVLAFFAEQGINPKRVRTYSVSKTYDDLSIIKLEMIMNDITVRPAPEAATPNCAGETAHARVSRLVGQRIDEHPITQQLLNDKINRE